jgi:hypothetical protein
MVKGMEQVNSFSVMEKAIPVTGNTCLDKEKASSTELMGQLF